MNTRTRFLAIVSSVVALTLLITGLLVSAREHESLRQSSTVTAEKIAPWVIQQTANNQTAEFLVILTEQADLRHATTLRSKQEKGRYVRDTLWAKAQATQAPLLTWLEARGVEHRAFYVVNAVWVKGTRALAEELAARSDIARIEGNPRVQNLTPVKLTAEELAAALRAPNATTAIEPGVNYIRAPEVWQMGFTGQGIVIGDADTGVQWDHPALRNHYRGWNGSAADHNYSWHDSVHNGGGSCGPNTAAPCDDNNHGTHTVGSVLGDDGSNNQIGVAPGAKFIACRNMDQGNGTPATYLECMEWFLAPYPVGGTPAQGDPGRAPDITTNSWGCPTSEGCQPATLQQAVEAQRAAGIMMVVAAGNSGSGCSTVVDPPSFYDASYTVGAFNASNGAIASFSSRGPVTVDSSNRVKPDISAPGVSVRSSIRGGSYGFSSGTSMATPHVAGAIALLWSARPALRNQIDQTEIALNQNSVNVTTTACNSGLRPNNVYGWGRLDIKAAVDATPNTNCSFGISPTSANVGSTASSGTVSVTTTTGCNWTASSNDIWLTLSGNTNGSGNGTVNYNVTANTGAQRTGTLTIAGQTVPVTQAAASSPPVVRAKKSDFDGDGKTDLSFWRGPATLWSILRSSNSTLQQVNWGASYAPYNDVAAPGDYDADGKTDIAVWRSSTGEWFIINSSNGQTQTFTHGQPGDTPVPGDYDGDGITDPAVWRGATTFWLIRQSSTGTTLQIAWGANYAPYFDTPVPGDYDGDGKTDIAIWRGNSTNWYIRRSSDGQMQTVSWGASYAPYFDTPVPGDYDGDGKYDVAVWRGNTSQWFIKRSSDGSTQTATWGASFAPYYDVPTPGDFDGDGKFDVAIWRPLDGGWYIIRSSTNTVFTQTHGQAGDTPVPAIQR